MIININEKPKQEVIKEIQKFLEKNNIGSVTPINFVPLQKDHCVDELNNDEYDLYYGPTYYVKTTKLSNKKRNKIYDFNIMMGYKYNVRTIIRDYDIELIDDIKLPNKKFEI